MNNRSKTTLPTIYEENSKSLTNFWHNTSSFSNITEVSKNLEGYRLSAVLEGFIKPSKATLKPLFPQKAKDEKPNLKIKGKKMKLFQR
jgi:hypothetical protein